MRFLPSEIVFFAGFVAYVVIRGFFEKRTKGVERTKRLVDWREKALFVLVGVGCMLLPVVYLFTPMLRFADYTLPVWAFWAGTAIMLLALWLFWRSHADLDKNWSVTLELRKDHQLIRHGVYRRMRHPMYAAILLFGLAQGLLLHNWLAGWSALVTFGVMYFVRVDREERMMVEHFGQEYRDYMQETGRVVPRFYRLSN